MTSGSLNKSAHLHVFLQPRYLRLLGTLLGLVFLSQFLAIRYTSLDSKYIRNVDVASSLPVNWNSWGLASPELDKDDHKKHGDWCTEAEYLDGEWVKREEEVTLDNIRRIYKYTDSGVLKCVSKDVIYGMDLTEDDPRMSARILETAQYEYRPRSRCAKHSWDRWNFAKFCLRSRAGCSLVGDSLTDQIYKTLVYSMSSGSNYRDASSLFHVVASVDMIFTITVNKAHPDATSLAQTAGVTMERLDGPVFVYYREHHLVDRDELDKAFLNVPGYVPFTDGPSFAEQRFVWDRSLWYERWTNLLRMPIKLVAKGERKVPVREENSMIALAMGPHWSPRELWPSGYIEKPDTYEHVLRGFQGTFSTILNNITQVAKEHKVLAWWRANTPGHFECVQYDEPENERKDQLSTRDPSKISANWIHYPRMNDYASTHLSYKPSDSNWYLRPSKYAMRYLDFWGMSVQRPDAHLKPTIDCLHFCSPGLPTEWLNFMWHMMVTQAENGDYDEEPVGDNWQTAGMPT